MKHVKDWAFAGLIAGVFWEAFFIGVGMHFEDWTVEQISERWGYLVGFPLAMMIPGVLLGAMVRYSHTRKKN